LDEHCQQPSSARDVVNQQRQEPATGHDYDVSDINHFDNDDFVEDFEVDFDDSDQQYQQLLDQQWRFLEDQQQDFDENRQQPSAARHIKSNQIY